MNSTARHGAEFIYLLAGQSGEVDEDEEAEEDGEGDEDGTILRWWVGSGNGNGNGNGNANGNGNGNANGEVGDGR